MTTCHKISSSLKEILDVFIKNKFRPLTLAEISDLLGEDANTINQRILRDNENLFFSPNPNSKPKIIQVRPGHPDVVCYMRDNQCNLCKKKLKPEKMFVEYINNQKKQKNTWDNLKLVCDQCSKTPPKVTKQKTQKVTQISNLNIDKSMRTWEYKTLIIRNVPKFDDYSSLSEEDPKYIPAHFIYQENSEIDLTKDIEEQEEQVSNWYTIIENGKIKSHSISDILNFFGIQGWELASIQQLSPQRNTQEENMIIYPTPGMLKNSVFFCLLKRNGGK